MNKSIKAKIILTLIVTITVPTILLFLLLSMSIQQQSEEAFIKSTKVQLKQVDETMSLFVEEAKQNITMVSRYELLREVHADMTTYIDNAEAGPGRPDPDDELGQEWTRFFKLVQGNHAGYADIYVGTRYGGMLISNPTELPGGYDPRKRPWYKEAVASPDKAIASKAYMSTDRKPMISVARVAKADGEVLGVAAIDISLADLTDMVAAIKLGDTGYVSMIQDDGVVLADPKESKYNFKNVSELGVPAYTTVFGLDNGSAEVELNGTTYIAQVHTSPKLGWKFVAFIEKAEITAPARSLVVQGSWTVGIALLVIVGVIWVFMDRSVIKPLKRVVGFLQGIAGGDYSARLEHRRRDEIGVILDALNEMSHTLSDNIEEITVKTREAEEKAEAAMVATREAEQARQDAERAKCEGMSHAAMRLEGIVERVSAAAEEISVQSDEIRNGTDIQTERIQATATAMEEMNATVLEVARNSGEAAEVGMEAKEHALTGSQVVEQSIAAMRTTQQQAEVLKDNMNVLGEQAEAIGQIMTVITDIADQTNLLALNAAIEAARAGDAGRGFAVVADEVRKLAEKTMGATKEVGDAIKAIQDAAARNIDSMETAVADLAQAVEMTNKSGEVLGEIVTRVEHSAGQIQGIATAAEEQSATSEEINRSIDEINRITAETARGVSESTEALAELAAQMSELANLIRELKSEGEACDTN